MHDTGMQNGRRFFDTYVSRIPEATVVDIGAQNLNGSLKDVCPPGARYLGVDCVAGKDVDVVLDDPHVLPFEDAYADVIVSSSCFEHAEMFWLLYLEIMRVLKPSGLFYLNAPSNGEYHRHPVDCWRFYPDCGTALLRWGRKNGLNNAVLESYVCNQFLDFWNDFVCVFIKDEVHVGKYPTRIVDSFADFTNGWVLTGNGDVQQRNARRYPQDQSDPGWKLGKRLQRSRVLLSLYKEEPPGTILTELEERIRRATETHLNEI